MTRLLTAQTRRVASERRAWAAEITREMRGDVSREDFGAVCGISETRVRECERLDEPGDKSRAPRLSIDKVAAMDEATLVAFCRSLLGPHFIVAKLEGGIDVQADAATMLREATDAVQAKLAGPATCAALHALAKEAGEAKVIFAVVEERALRDATALAPKPLRVAGSR